VREVEAALDARTPFPHAVTTNDSRRRRSPWSRVSLAIRRHRIAGS